MFRRRPKRPPRGEFPASFERAFFRQTLPSTPPREAKAILEHVRGKGWSEQKIAELILPYLPPPGSPIADGPYARVPPNPPRGWFERHLPDMDASELRRVVDDLERRGWSQPDIALTVLPHLLPKLPPPDADAILDGLRDLGFAEDDIAELSRRR